MIITVVHDYQARLHSYQLIADACGIPPRPQIAPANVDLPNRG